MQHRTLYLGEQCGRGCLELLELLCRRLNLRKRAPHGIRPLHLRWDTTCCSRCSHTAHGPTCAFSAPADAPLGDRFDAAWHTELSIFACSRHAVRTTGSDASVLAFCARNRREHVRPGRRTHGRPSDVMRHCSKLRVHCAVCYRHFTGTLAHHSAAQMSQVRRSPPAMQRQDRTAPRSRRNSTTASRRIHRKYERERSVRGNRNGHRRWQFAALRRKRVRVRLRTFAALCCCARSASCSRLNSVACATARL